MRNKIFCFALGALVFALGFPAEAQQPRKTPRVGILRLGSPPDPLVEAFRRGLRELGYVEDQNITVELRWTEGKADRLDDLAAELVRLKVDVIVAPGGLAARAANRASMAIPIVMIAVTNPVGEGLVTSLARPGGNITGLSNMSFDLSGKRLETLKEISPKTSRVAVLYTPDEEGRSQAQATEEAGRVLKLQLQPLEARGLADIERAFTTMARERAEALLVLGSAVIFEHRRRLAELAAKSRRPALYPHSGFVEPGGLMSYGPDFPDLYRRAAVYVDKILKGTKAADLPVEQPTKFELVINLKTAKQIGLTIPPNVLARADKVIK
jgi:putative ABC transport system substrate-binding protein